MCPDYFGIFYNLFVSEMNYKTKIKQKGLKVNWIAQQLTLSRPTLSAYLNGTRAMPYDVEQRLKTLIK